MDKINTILSVKNLNISFPSKQIIRDLSLDIYEGELVALVGESGSGKTLVCRSLLSLAPKGAMVAYDELTCPAPSEMSLVMQDALSALDPVMPIGKQILEANRKEPPSVLELLKRVGIEDPSDRAKQWPSEFSGGMRQRVALAIALAMKPKLIFADEPTTALDMDMQIKIMSILNDIKQEKTAVIFVSHDLRLIRNWADRVLILQDGRIIESGRTDEIFNNPLQEYTKELIRSERIGSPKNHTHGRLHYHDKKIHSHEPLGKHSHSGPHSGPLSDPAINSVVTIQDKKMEKFTSYSPLVEIRNLSKVYPLGKKKSNTVLNDISFSINKGEVLGLCGPSGIGKSTLARIIAGLEEPSTGEIIKSKTLNIQMIFQDSLVALGPHMSVYELIGEPLYLRDKKKPKRQIILDLMGKVGLNTELIDRRPSQLSGGQRQRVAIARSIATIPDLIIADEPISSLDATNASKIVHLLRQLKDEYNTTMLFISHDLHLLAHIADEIVEL